MSCYKYLCYISENRKKRKRICSENNLLCYLFYQWSILIENNYKGDFNMPFTKDEQHFSVDSILNQEERKSNEKVIEVNTYLEQCHLLNEDSLLSSSNKEEILSLNLLDTISDLWE